MITHSSTSVAGSLPAAVRLAARTAVAGLFALAVVGAVPAAAAAQKYLLQLKPKLGDTLRMELEEQREHTGRARFGGADSSRTMSTRLRMFSRAIVQGKLRSAVTVLAIIDSVSLFTTDRHAPTMTAGQRMLFRLGEDGTMRVVDGETGANRRASELVALMPAALPTYPVAVGETWARSIPIVVGRNADDGVVRAFFRLDSISRDERLAYISMRGEMRRDSVSAGPPRGTRMHVSGTVTGELLLDRSRGWLTESSFAVLLRTTLISASPSDGYPIRFLTRITQRMRALDRK